MSVILPTYDDVVSAYHQIEKNIVHTPLLSSAVLNERLSANVYVKAECLQTTGSFKFRGACNRISRLSEEEKSRGVMAYSSGNHAQGVAAAAKIFGTNAKILMPTDTPLAKVEGVKFWGGEVIFYDRATENREAIALQISQDEGRVLVPPYENFHIISGQGTAGLEAVEQLQALGVKPDVVVCPAGGGGLIAGVGLAVKHHYPETDIWSAEPVDFDDHKRSFESGKRETNAKLTGSICDAIITPTPGEMTWSLNSKQLTWGAAISDDEALEAMAFAWRYFKIVVEPGGVVALAAVISGKIPVVGKTVCVLASGGNVDRDMFARAVDIGH